MGKRILNWDHIEGQWKQRRGKAVHHWGKIMNDELAAIAGKYEELVGRLQEKYGIAKEKSNERIKEYANAVEQLKKANARLVILQKSLSRKKQPNKNPKKLIKRTGEKKKSGRAM